VLAANAAAASQNLNQITAALNTSENLVLLQQTLESARDVFQSAQKIMADVDELTGDPTVRNNFRDLINGLTNLVSSTQQLETETQLAQLLQTVDQVSAAELPGRLPTDQPRLVYDGRRYVVHLADRPMDRPVDTAAAR
jgi:phospholipid/cholesterol/gamma-HCH transport system substrate-binding protein